MLEKNSAENKVCTYCDRDALPDTYPPVCEEHIHTKQAAGEATTLKELETKDE